MKEKISWFDTFMLCFLKLHTSIVWSPYTYLSKKFNFVRTKLSCIIPVEPPIIFCHWFFLPTPCIWNVTLCSHVNGIWYFSNKFTLIIINSSQSWQSLVHPEVTHKSKMKAENFIMIFVRNSFSRLIVF